MLKLPGSASPTLGGGKHEVNERVRGRSQPVDRWMAGIAAVVAVTGATCVVAALDPGGPVAWSYQVIVLWVLLAAGAGRALLGYRHPGEATEAARSRLGTLPLWPAVAAAAVLPYLHSLGIGFLSDDFGLLAAAKLADSPLDALRLWPHVSFWRPVSEVLWWAGAQLWGGAALGYHLLNLALHVGNSLLVYVLGARLIGNRYAGGLGGLLFAVHPTHVEPVVWACCLPDLAATGSSLLSLLLLDVYLAARTRARRGLALGGALAAFLVALLSKESSLALPGAAVLWLVLAREGERARRVVAVGLAYSAVLSGFLIWRLAVLGRIGGYEIHLGFWNTLFPSAPLRHTGLFFFPVNRELFQDVLGPILPAAAVLLMAAGLMWWIRGLVYVPSRRLWFYLGYVFVMFVPAWMISPVVAADMEGARFGYLPTAALAWLFGDMCGGRGTRWLRARMAALAIIAAAGLLTAWYVMPWRKADRLAGEVLAAGQEVVAELPATGREPVVFFRDLPDTYLGAQVFRNCFELALSQAVERPVVAYTVSLGRGSSRVTPEVMDFSSLLPGEYEVAWREETRTMDILRSGGAPTRTSAKGAAR